MSFGKTPNSSDTEHLERHFSSSNKHPTTPERRVVQHGNLNINVLTGGETFYVQRERRRALI